MIDTLAQYLAATQRRVRVSTGFFTVQGYDLIRPYLPGKAVSILVGYDESSKERLRAKLVEDILAHLSLWDAADRRAAVLDLVGKLARGELRLAERVAPDLLEARIRNRDHAKVFIFDEAWALVGSSNLTVSGLYHNAEAVTRVDPPERVSFWSNQFQIYWEAPDTHDLTQALLEALRRWLDLASPYDVYLRTIQALVPDDDTESPRPAYKMPVRYQMVVIERVLRQLKEWRGAMLVASTGLGKTIMATHTALRLNREGRIFNVIIFAPRHVQPDWQAALDSAGLNHKIFTRDLLDQPVRSAKGKLREMLKALDCVDDCYIIFVDESQHFKNRLRISDGTARYSFRRLVNVVNERHPYIVLLTATPLAKGVDDLNNQLYLLPHTAPANLMREDGQIALSAMADLVLEPRVWRVAATEDFFQEYMSLPVCTVISTSQVAKDFAAHTPQGDYLDFGEIRQWIPQVEVVKIKVPVLLEEAMSQALGAGYFTHQLRTFRARGRWQRSETSVKQEAEVAWASSPAALQEVLRKTIAGTYKVKFIRSAEERERVLGPILEALANQPPEADEKLMTLCTLLRDFHARGQKVIVFTERHATALYLEKILPRQVAGLKVASVVHEADQERGLKDFDEVLPLILNFAPEANWDKIEPGHTPTHHDVFITTDAYSTGVNLQDASVVISYDLAWTADILIQRAGRILRFWKSPRRVHFYAFVGDFHSNIELHHKTGGVEKRLHRLTERSQQAEKFSELPMFPESERTEYTSLRSLANVTIEDLGLAEISEIEEFSGVSPFLRHITELRQNMDRAAAIPDDISSALAYRGTRRQLYLLLRYKRDYQWTLYDIPSDDLIALQEDRLLDLIRCTPATPAAPVNADEIERYAQRARDRWCQANGVRSLEHVERICALYLVPQGDAGDFGPMLKSAAET